MLNQIVLMGRLTADPDVRKTLNGVSVTTFTLAVDRDRHEQDGSRAADFFPVVAWRSTADFIGTYFTKGRMMAVSGQLRNRSYEKDGQKRTVTEIVADKVSFCGGKADSDTRGGYSGEITDIGDDDGDLPF